MIRHALLVALALLTWIASAHAQPVPPNNGAYTGVVGTVQWRGNPLGICQLSVTSGAAVALTACSGGIPTNARVAFITTETAAIRYRDDGTAPTTTLGYPLLSTGGQQLVYSAAPMSAFSMIAQGTTTTVDVAFYQ